MERRRIPRVKPPALITVMVLGEGQPAMEAGVIDVSPRGVRLRTPAPLPTGTPLKIEFGEELLLGEVAHCTEDHGAYQVGLAVKHRLEGLAALHRLTRMLQKPMLEQDETPIMER